MKTSSAWYSICAFRGTCLLFLLFTANSLRANTYYSIQNGPWTTSSTWSLSSGGPAIASGYPGAADNVVIEGGYTVTIATAGVESDQAANLTIGGASTSGTLSYPVWNPTSTLTVSGDLTVGGGIAAATGTISYATWGLTITCGRLLQGTGAASTVNPLQQDFTFTGTFTLPAAFNKFRNFIVDGGTVTLASNITTNGSVSPAIDAGSTLDMNTYSMTIGGYGNFVINGTLILRGNSGGFGSSNFPNTFTNLTIATGSNIDYGGAGNQTIYPTTYSNLTLDGGGIKTVGSNGYVSSLTISYAGSGYDCGASLSFSGGGGSGASGSASASSGDQLTSVSIQHAGTGYTSAPTVTVDANCDGSGASVTASITTVNTATVNATLTMQGTAVLGTNAIAYGASSAMVYAGSSAQTTGAELPTNWTGSGGVFIDNSSGVTLGAATTIGSSLNLEAGTLSTSTANLLTISNTSATAISGGSPSSYILGPVTITLPANLASGATYVLPIGQPTSYLPLTLNNPTTGSGTANLTIEAFNSNSGGVPGTGVLGVAHGQYWSMSTSGSFLGSSISLSKQSTLGSIDLIGESATLNGAYNSLGGTISGNSIINSNNIGSSPQMYFVFASDITVLALEMSSLAATATSEGIDVSWTSDAGGEAAIYQIQRSEDDTHFSPLDSLASVETPGSASYRWLDREAVPGIAYIYRVAARTVDGNWVYSNIARATMEAAKAGISLFPNPATGGKINLSMSGLPAGLYLLEFINDAGQTIQIINTNYAGGYALIPINLGASLPPGVYVLRLTGGALQQGLPLIIGQHKE